MSSYDKSGAMDWICKVSNAKNQFLTKHSITAPATASAREEGLESIIDAHWSSEAPMDRRQSELTHRKMNGASVAADLYTIFNGDGSDHLLFVHGEDRGKRALRTSQGLFDLGSNNKAYMITPSSRVYSRTNDKFSVDKRFKKLADVKSSAENFPFAVFECGSALILTPRAFGGTYVKLGGGNTVCTRFFKQTKRSNTMCALMNEGMKKGGGKAVSASSAAGEDGGEIHTRVYFHNSENALDKFDIPLKTFTDEGEVIKYVAAKAKEYYGAKDHVVTRVVPADNWPSHVPNTPFMRAFDVYEEGGRLGSMFLCPRFEENHCMTYVRMRDHGNKQYTDWTASTSLPLGSDCLVREKISMDSFANMANAAMGPVQGSLRNKVVSSLTSNVYGNTLVADILLADGTVVQAAFEPVALPVMKSEADPSDKGAGMGKRREASDTAKISPFRQSI